MIRAGEDWLGLLGARQLVASSVQDWQPLPVLWDGKGPEPGARLFWRRRARLVCVEPLAQNAIDRGRSLRELRLAVYI